MRPDLARIAREMEEKPTGFDPSILARAMHFGAGFAKRPVGKMSDDELEYIVKYRNGEISG